MVVFVCQPVDLLSELPAAPVCAVCRQQPWLVSSRTNQQLPVTHLCVHRLLVPERPQQRLLPVSLELASDNERLELDVLIYCRLVELQAMSIEAARVHPAHLATYKRTHQSIYTGEEVTGCFG